MEKSIRKILVIGLCFLFLGASATIGASMTYTNGQMQGAIQKDIPAIQNDIVAQKSLVGNIKISTSAGDNYHPQVTQTSRGVSVVVYEQGIDLFTKMVPCAYSTDRGLTWTEAFLFDSTVFQGTGLLQYPKINYNPNLDLLYTNMMDPNAESYNCEMYFIDGDIANVLNATGYAISGTSSSGYYYIAGCHTNNFFLQATTENYGDFESILGLGWFTYPNFDYPAGIGGFYYDGESLFQSSPVLSLDASQNDNRVFIVYESGRAGRNHNVAIKSGTADEALITSGEQQNAMDKYGDIEQMPASYVTETYAKDPDVSGSGTKVCVVYTTQQTGDVLCSYSTTGRLYEPEFNWKVSTVETGASDASVYMNGDTVYCAYVKGGNLYLKQSSDAGATWGAAVKMNDGPATVVTGDSGVDVGKGGIVFADTRGGTAQIYFAPIVPLEPDTPTITGTASGDAKTPYEYTFVTTDGQNDQVTYTIDWGDGSAQETAGPAASGTAVKVSHSFAAAGDFIIKAKAKDTGGHESGWGTLPVTMPYIYHPLLQFMQRLFERFPNAFPILRQLLG